MKRTPHHAPASIRRACFGLLFLAPAALVFGQSGPASTSADEPVQLSAFEVNANQDHGYASTNAVSGTRFNTPLVNIPQSVIVLNQDFLKDVGALSVVDAAQYVSGVATTAGPNRDVFLVNGYGVSVTTDGFPDDTSQAQGLTTPIELIDRVEIIKGPSAVLYGSTTPGGNVNRVTKKPEFDHNFGSEQLIAGEGGLARGVIDVNRTKSTAAGDMAVRVIGSFEHYDTLANFSDSNSWFIAPMFAWKLTPKTTLVVQPSYLDRNHHKKFATLFQFRPYGSNAGPISLNLPRDVDWGGKYAREKFTIKKIFAQLTQLVNPNWVLRFTATGHEVPESSNDIIPRDLLLDNQRMQRTWRIVNSYDTYKLAAFDSLMKYDLGPTKNQTLFLAQYYKSDSDVSYITGRKLSGQDVAGGESANATFSNLPLINVYNPDPVALNAWPDSTYLSSDTSSGGKVSSAALIQMVKLFNDRLVANVGARYDHSQAYGVNNLTHKPSAGGSNSHITKRAGVCWVPHPSFSLFYNYSETFTPQLGANPDGTTFKPTEGTISEGGVKLGLLQGRISGTASVFSVANKNLLVIDPDPERASAGYRTQSAKDTLDGVEFDLHFDLIRGLQVVASYSNIKSKTHSGERVRDVPKDTAAMFASYKFNPAWTAGAGWRYKGSRPGDAANTFYLPGVSVFDAFLAYRYSSTLTFRLNCTNVFNKYYADSAINRNLIFAGPARRLRLGVEYDF